MLIIISILLIFCRLERGVFDAVDQKFLKSCTFAIYKKGELDLTEQLLETYTFSFEYPVDSPPTLNGKVMDRDNIKQQAIAFIRCLVEFTSTLDILPAGSSVLVYIFAI